MLTNFAHICLSFFQNFFVFILIFEIGFEATHNQNCTELKNDKQKLVFKINMSLHLLAAQTACISMDK